MKGEKDECVGQEPRLRTMYRKFPLGKSKDQKGYFCHR